MKTTPKNLLPLLCLCLSIWGGKAAGQGQYPQKNGKYNHNWLLMPAHIMSFDTLAPHAPSLKSIPFQGMYTVSITSVSDYHGKFLFYAKYDSIYNGMGQGFGKLYANMFTLNSALVSTQGIVAIPEPADTNKWLLYVQGIGYAYSGHPHGDTLLREYRVNPAGNGGVGSLAHVKTDSSAHNLHQPQCGMLRPIRHGNGRDWWMLAHQFYTDSFVCHYISPQGRSAPTKQSVPSPLIGGDSAAGVRGIWAG